MDEKKDFWQYLDVEGLSRLEKKERIFYRKKIKRTVQLILCPLYMYAVKNGFDDTSFLKQETIHGMVEELKSFFEQHGIDREERMNIIIKSRKHQ